ncbi:hypothetical protein, partial [Bacillus cereus]|uniref:hypothetical protein n=1 Tax=Bacillus cereus TaxID=1396 RepID=UPI002852691A
SLLMEDVEKGKKIHYLLGLNIQEEDVQNKKNTVIREEQRKPKRELVGKIDGRDIGFSRNEQKNLCELYRKKYI